MKRKLFLLFFFSILVFWLSADCQSRKGLLWEISGNDLKRPSYLFGTIHLLCPDELNLSDSVTMAITHTDQMVLEIDFSDPTVPDRITKGMKVERGNQLKRYLTRDQFDYVRNYFENSLHLSFNSIQKVKPIFLMTLLIPKAMNCQATSLEKKLTDLAAMYHRGIIGLESVEEQISYIDRISPKTQANMLLKSIQKFDSTRYEYHHMVSLYKSGRIDELFVYIQSQNKEFSNVTQTLVYDRNKQWVQKIKSIIERKPSFIAVGAGHLGGDKGLISLLEQQGYTLRPIE